MVAGGDPFVDGSDEGRPKHTTNDETHIGDEITHRDLMTEGERTETWTGRGKVRARGKGG